jgi:hypothetical protein
MRSALRIAIVVALVLAAVAAAASMFAWSRAKPAPAAVEARLVAGHTIQRQALEQGSEALAASALQIAEDRAFAAYIVAALGREVVDTVSIRDLLNERSAELGLEGSAVISAGGTVVVGIGALRTLAGQGDSQPGVATALAQARPAAGFWHHDGTALQVALAPIRQGPLLEGLLVLARPINRAQVDALARDSALDLHLMLGSRAGALLASSDPQVGAGIIRAAAGRQGAAALEAPSPGRAGELASFDDGAWLHSTLPRRELEAQAASRQRLLLAAEIAAVIALILAGALALTRGAAAGAAAATPAQRRPESASQDQRRGRELEGWLSRRTPSAPVAEVAASPAPGILLGERYQLLTTQDESVGASVHRALDRQQDKVVTLFCLKAGAPRETARNFRIGAECRRAMRVVHPNLARIVDVSQDRAMVMIAVETVAGVTLGDLLEQQGPPPLQAGLLVAKRVCSALRELHEAGALMRRIDPGQVLFESDGRIRLLPVTAATVAEAMREDSAAGSSAGADQASGRRADLQALGGFLRLLFTGRSGELPMSLPPELRTLIARCLQAGDSQGYVSAEAVLADLDRI